MRSAITTILEGTAILAITAGVALIYVPAGLIVLGALCLLLSWRLSA